MFYIAICDDEQMDREQIQKLTQKICESEAIPIKIVCFENAQELFLSIRSGGGVLSPVIVGYNYAGAGWDGVGSSAPPAGN